jgi:hypothetical protein
MVPFVQNTQIFTHFFPEQKSDQFFLSLLPIMTWESPARRKGNKSQTDESSLLLGRVRHRGQENNHKRSANHQQNRYTGRSAERRQLQKNISSGTVKVHRRPRGSRKERAERGFLHGIIRRVRQGPENKSSYTAESPKDLPTAALTLRANRTRYGTFSSSGIPSISSGMAIP